LAADPSRRVRIEPVPVEEALDLVVPVLRQAFLRGERPQRHDLDCAFL
jgi:hypothetical protein